MKKIENIGTIAVFLLIIFTIPIMTKLKTNEYISEFENRKLAEAPKFTREALFSGEYFEDWEEYLSDHILGRDSFVETFNRMNMFLVGKTRVNNIVMADNGYLLPFNPHISDVQAEEHEKNIVKMAEQLSKLSKTIEGYGGHFSFIGVPTQQSVNKDLYPSYFNNNSDFLSINERLMFENLEKREVDYVNINEVFKDLNKDELYFKTDHHFNFNGAYKTYVEMLANISNNTDFNIRGPLERDELDIVTLDNEFRGSRNREIYYLHPHEDRVQLAYPKEEIDYKVITNGNPDARLYEIPSKEEQVNYGVYMGGDMAETIIKTNREDLPNALIFGDSFTNALEPLVYYHFNETRAIDLRHYDKKNLYEYIEKYKPDVVFMVRDESTYTSFSGNGKFK